MAAGESGVFSAVRTGLETDPAGRPLGTDGLQTFGGVRAMARYVKLGVTVPASGGTIAISEVRTGVMYSSRFASADATAKGRVTTICRSFHPCAPANQGHECTCGPKDTTLLQVSLMARPGS